MGYLFTNNWPYSYTTFPTMVDHVDPPNNAYFTGLHTEIQNIENTLGLDPAGSYATVKERLAALSLESGLAIKQYSYVALAADVSNNTTSWAEITQLEINLNTSANNLLIFLSGSCGLNTTSAISTISGEVKLKIDDSDENATSLLLRDNGNVQKEFRGNTNIIQLKSVSAGSHKIEVWWKCSTSGTTFSCSPAASADSFHFTLTVFEVTTPV